MPPPQQSSLPIAFDLLLAVKETQLQHGLRAENHARYHQYLTHRVATLRRQLGLGNDRKKFLNKEINATNATDPRHVELLALYAERCWAEAEAQIAKRNTAKNADNQRPVGGVPPACQSGKRLNKAVVWSGRLRDVAATVADPRLRTECRAYDAEMRGRCAAFHGRFDEARKAFLEARTAYFSLHPSSSEVQWPIVLAKVVELDDRVYYAMQCLGEDPASYKPALGSAATTQFATTVDWNGRRLLVSSVKVKDLLREAIRSDPMPLKARAAAASSSSSSDGSNGGASTLINVGMQTRVLEAFDRSVGLYNDALAHCRQDLREASDGRKTELQLLVHYLSYHVSLMAYERTTFMVDVFERRFFATKETLLAGRGPTKECPAAQYASPLEVIRLYDSALEAVGDMNLLPGVMGTDSVTAMEAECRGGRLLMLGESWRVANDAALAAACCTAAATVLQDAKTPRGAMLLAAMQRSVIAMTAESVLQQQASPAGAVLWDMRLSSSAAASPPPPAASVYLSDSLDECRVSAKLAKFPPDYQAVPCKPVFVDIASTFVEYPEAPQQGRAGGVSPPPQTAAACKPSPAAAAAPSTGAAAAQPEGGQPGKPGGAGWGGWFGWGKK